ncbi:AmmeMemoRadiSam system protein B, partial [Myxococcota bacterium]
SSRYLYGRLALQVLALLMGPGGCTHNRFATVAGTDGAPVPRPSDADGASPARSARPTGTRSATTQPASQSRVRPSALAGTGYPARRSAIAVALHRILRTLPTGPRLPHKPVALIVPHAGWEYSGPAAMSAFRHVKEDDYARVVVIGPTHRVGFRGFSLSDAAAYRTPLGDVPVCREASELRAEPLLTTVPGADHQEHSLEIELPMLQQRLGSFCLVPILVGQTDPAMEQAMATQLATLHDGRTLFVVSSDFVHYGPDFAYTPYGPTALRAHARIVELEKQALSLIHPQGAAPFRALIDSTGATICGHRGISVLLELLGQIAPRAKPLLLAHYGSSELPGAEGTNGVWYAAVAYLEGTVPATEPLRAPRQFPRAGPGRSELSPQAGERLVRMARATLTGELSDSRQLERELVGLGASTELERIQAVFVTLRKAGRLRGCVGQVEPEYWLPEAVVHAASGAALHDGRFSPVMPHELNELSVEVTVLSPPRPVASSQQITVGRHGIILQKDGRRALFLPQVATEQRWNRTQTLQALSRKAGLAPEAWSARDAKLWVFTGQSLGERRDASTASSPDP